MSHNFEITRDRKFLQFFMDKRNMFRLAPEMVERLRNSDDPYGRYGYGRWLYALQPDGDESIKEAQKCFEYASENGVADAKQLLSMMAYYGDLYNEKKGIFEKSNIMALILNAQAQEEGSEFAKLQNSFDLFMGNLIPANKELAIQRCNEGESEPGTSLMWTEQAGWFHQFEGRNEEALKKYEQCAEGGLYETLHDMAIIYHERGNIALYESLMEEGIEKGASGCHLWGSEAEDEWDRFNPELQEEIHRRLAKNLYKGVELGNGMCAYVLAYYLIYGKMGFEKNLEEGIRIAYIGVKYRNTYCIGLILDEYITELSDEEQLILQLKSLRYGDDELLENVMEDADLYDEMGYGDEIRKIWAPKWRLLQKETESESESESEPEPVPEPEPEKTEINPTVLVIHPSGSVDFVEADVNPMSFREMAGLIDAEGLDAVHFSDALAKVTKTCGLTRNVAMYVDRNGIAKGLEDNAVGSILYGHGYEIRGAVIIVLEDNRYDTWSFDFKEDIENVCEAIDKITGLLRRDIG